jgi:hypothetical protein
MSKITTYLLKIGTFAFVSLLFVIIGCSEFDNRQVTHIRAGGISSIESPSRDSVSVTSTKTLLQKSDESLIDSRPLKRANLEFFTPNQDGKILPENVSADELRTFTRQLTRAMRGVLLDPDYSGGDVPEIVYNERPGLFPYFKDKTIKYRIIERDNMHIIVDVCDSSGNDIFASDASWTSALVEYVMPQN